MSAPGSVGERQEHLDAIIAFAVAGQRRPLFTILDILAVKWPQEMFQKMSIPTEHATHVPEQRKKTPLQKYSTAMSGFDHRRHPRKAHDARPT